MNHTLVILSATVVLLGALTSAALAQQEDARLELPAVDRPAARSTEGASDLAIIVAVENYHNLFGVPGAVKTGLDWKVFFSEHLGLGDDRVLFLKDHKVTPAKLEREIPKFLKKADKKGRVWFVFVGHGAPYQAVEGDTQISDGLLVGVGAFNDTYQDFIDGSLRQSKLEAMLAAGKQAQTLMVLDACFSGKTPYDQNLTGTQAVIPSRVIPKVGPKDIVFSAAAHNEVANLVPGNTAKRPAFSYVLLGALRGWADADGDDQVTVAESENYVQRALLGLQTPSATVKDSAVRKQALVKKAPEADPGASALLQRVISGAKSYGEKACATAGMVRSADTQGHCCWPGQAYSSTYGACVGTPMCPDGLAIAEDGSCRKASGASGYAQVVERDSCTSAARCIQLADDAHYGRSGQRDAAKAAKFYEKACKMGDDGLRACAKLGFMIQYGQGGRKLDERQAFELYKKSCTQKVAWGCAGLGYYYNHGLGGLSADVVKAVSLYQRACDQGALRGCSNLGVMYDKGRGVSQDLTRTRKLYEKACDGGDIGGCANLGVLYRDGRSVIKDLARARALFQSACDAGDMPGCFNLGHLYKDGLGVARDYDRARRLFEVTCDARRADACTTLGYLHETGKGVAKSASRAAPFYTLGCDGDNAIGCSNLATLYRYGRGVAQNEARARELYSKACRKGYAKACEYLRSMN